MRHMFAKGRSAKSANVSFFESGSPSRYLSALVSDPRRAGKVEEVTSTVGVMIPLTSISATRRWEITRGGGWIASPGFAGHLTEHGNAINLDATPRT